MIADAWNDLDEDLSDELEGDDVDPVRVERLIRAVARHRRLLAADETVAASEIDRIHAWLQDRRKAHDCAFLEQQLANYHEARLARDPRAKTISLPSGDLVSRKQPDRWSFAPEFVVWAKQHRPDLTRLKTEVDKDKAKKLAVHDGKVVLPGGEIVPGVEVEPGGISFSVKISGES